MHFGLVRRINNGLVQACVAREGTSYQAQSAHSLSEYRGGVSRTTWPSTRMRAVSNSQETDCDDELPATWGVGSWPATLALGHQPWPNCHPISVDLEPGLNNGRPARSRDSRRRLDRRTAGPGCSFRSPASLAACPNWSRRCWTECWAR